MKATLTPTAMDLIKELEALRPLIGNTPLVKLKQHGHFFAKLEYANFMGSIKDRPAFYIIEHALKQGEIDKDTIVIESTSGNFGVALAGICKKLGLKFIPVIDPNISREKEDLLRLLSHKVIKVTGADHSGGYLLSRIQKVKELMGEIPNAYNPNQYENDNNYLAY